MSSFKIIRGISGSGKSTLAKTFTDHVHFEADMFFYDNDGNYNFDPSKLYQAHRWCQDMALFNLKNGMNVVVSNTFTTRKELIPYFDMAWALNITPDVIVCAGNYQNIHGVPQEALDRMRNRWVDYTWDDYLEEKALEV